jgi:hypothetical protein
MFYARAFSSSQIARQVSDMKNGTQVSGLLAEENISRKKLCAC